MKQTVLARINCEFHLVNQMAQGSSCPYEDEAGSAHANACPYDPATNMPSDLNIQDEGSQNLSDKRTASSIPRHYTQPQNQNANSNNTWTYPSPRMFYNALHRKGQAVPADSIPAVLTIHNFLNERVWQEIVGRWEAYDKTCGQPRKLIRFQGKPGERTWRSWLFGKPGSPPFDRHDWVIDRCGQPVTYIIDYYGEPEKPKGLLWPWESIEPPGQCYALYGQDDHEQQNDIAKRSLKKEPAAVFYVDVRPAPDTLSNLWLRMRLRWHEWCNPRPPFVEPPWLASNPTTPLQHSKQK